MISRRYPIARAARRCSIQQAAGVSFAIGYKPHHFAGPAIVVVAGNWTPHDHGCARLLCFAGNCTNSEQRTLRRFVMAMVAFD